MKHIRVAYLQAIVSAASLITLHAQAQEQSWNRTLERISSGVVSIKIDSTRSFDTERNQSSQATGFVVDAQRGIILTNRHVVTPGPVRAQAVFLNQEEVDLIPVYRDPVHDFGFFRYDPSQLKFITPTELTLVPEAAQIGRDIRVIGNDAGEQLSILAGTIARLDRQAPNYGRGAYNDFNTFYLQAASSTSGGSSGSPVVDIEGRVVALNAGANSQAASSFFLPLDRVGVAFDLIREGASVPRGTVQTEFVHKPYAEVQRLGLTSATEARVRAAFPNQTGLLVVEQVIPSSPASGQLRPGDILTEVNGRLVTQFVPLAAALDGNVGNTISVVVERAGERVERMLPVDDLHSITPGEYIEYGDGVFHKLSYQQARHFYRPVEGVYVANPGYVFGKAAIPRGSIITAIGSQRIQDLDDMQHVIETTPESQQATVRFVTFDDPQSEKQNLVVNDRSWFPAARCRRDDQTGVWPCEELAPSPPRKEEPPQEGTTFPRQAERHVQEISSSLVLVNFAMPYTVSGVADRYYYGTGLIADAERGWVVVDRNTVPVAMGDVRLTFAGSLEIPGRVEYIHPLHNLAVVSYDPAMIGSTPVKSAVFAPQDLLPGQDVAVVGLGPDFKLMSQSSEIATVSAASFPLSRTRHVALTAVGREVLEAARRTLAQRGQEVGALARRGRAGPLRLDYVPATGYGLVPALVHEAGGLAVRTEEVDLERALARVAGADSDAALLRHPPARAGLAVVTVAAERLGVLVAAGDPWAAAGALPSAALSGRTLIVPERDRAPAQLGAVLGVLARHDARPRLDGAAHVDGSLRRVERGEAVALVTASGAGALPAGLRWVPLREPTATVGLHLVHRDGDASAGLAALLEAAARLGARLGGTPAPVVPALL